MVSALPGAYYWKKMIMVLDIFFFKNQDNSTTAGDVNIFSGFQKSFFLKKNKKIGSSNHVTKQEKSWKKKDFRTLREKY